MAVETKTCEVCEATYPADAEQCANAVNHVGLGAAPAGPSEGPQPLSEAEQREARGAVDEGQDQAPAADSPAPVTEPEPAAPPTGETAPANPPEPVTSNAVQPQDAAPVGSSAKALEDMTKAELKQIAEPLRIDVGAFESKASVIEKIRAAQAAQQPPADNDHVAPGAQQFDPPVAA